LAALSGGIHPLALPLLVVAWLAYAAFVAGLGLFFSLISRSTLVATLATVATAVGACGCHRALWMLFRMAWDRRPVPAYVEWIGDFLLYGCTPPVSLSVLSCRSVDFELGAPVLLTWQMVGFALMGVGCYAVAAGLLWTVLVKCFDRVTSRMPLPRATKSFAEK
jgi:hypothetical protein